MFVGGISNQTKSKIKSCGVNVYEIPKEVLRLRTTINNFRWKLYKDFLKENKDKYNMIFTADVRDTIFQKDVFQFYKFYFLKNLLGCDFISFYKKIHNIMFSIILMNYCSNLTIII